MNNKLFAATERLSFAAECRDNTAGDPARLIEVKAELAEANRQYRLLMQEAWKYELSAPALLDALKDLLDMPENNGTFAIGSLRKSIKDKARAAIAKATGADHETTPDA